MGRLSSCDMILVLKISLDLKMIFLVRRTATVVNFNNIRKPGSLFLFSFFFFFWKGYFTL